MCQCTRIKRWCFNHTCAQFAAGSYLCLVPSCFMSNYINQPRVFSGSGFSDSNEFEIFTEHNKQIMYVRCALSYALQCEKHQHRLYSFDWCKWWLHWEGYLLIRSCIPLWKAPSFVYYLFFIDQQFSQRNHMDSPDNESCIALCVRPIRSR